MTRSRHAALWQRWLGWRYPHYHRMEDDAAATLFAGAQAVVRVGFNGTLRTPAEWHVTLFTPRRATPCPADTVAAAARMKPAGTVLHHVMPDAPTGEERTPADPLGVQIADAALRHGSSRPAGDGAGGRGAVARRGGDRRGAPRALGIPARPRRRCQAGDAPGLARI